MLEEESESTADSSSEDHFVATDDNVDWPKVTDGLMLENIGRIS